MAFSALSLSKGFTRSIACAPVAGRMQHVFQNLSSMKAEARLTGGYLGGPLRGSTVPQPTRHSANDNRTTGSQSAAPATRAPSR
eukprot:1119002-Pyramimonas_sp.AAC.2